MRTGGHWECLRRMISTGMAAEARGKAAALPVRGSSMGELRCRAQKVGGRARRPLSTWSQSEATRNGRPIGWRRARDERLSSRRGRRLRGAVSSSSGWTASLRRFGGQMAGLAALVMLGASFVALVGANREISSSPSRQALEAELDSLLQQHVDADGAPQEASSQLLSEAIISRLMLGNLSEPGALVAGERPLASASEALAQQERDELVQGQTGGGDPEQEAQVLMAGAPDAARLRNLMGYLHSYEMAGGLNQYPILPENQASTIKRASARMGNLIKQQQMGGGRGQASYARNNFDFGLGKRPDSSVSRNLLRFGDSSPVGSGSQLVSGALGKRPSSHRFDFGLGKRVANVSSVPTSTQNNSHAQRVFSESLMT